MTDESFEIRSARLELMLLLTFRAPLADVERCRLLEGAAAGPETEGRKLHNRHRWWNAGGDWKTAGSFGAGKAGTP